MIKGVVSSPTAMWGKLLLVYVCVLAFVLIGPALSERDKEQYDFSKRLFGGSGEVCTKQGRRCISNDTAQCVSNRCVCKRPGYKGEAEIECVERKERLCYVSGDPHLHGYGRASVDVDLPCRFRASRFTTKNIQGIHEASSSCAIEVYATNLQLDGRYVVRSVHISVGISDSAAQLHSQFEVYKTRDYSINDTTIYNYQTRVIARDGIWGSENGVLDGVIIEPTYDEENNFAMLEVPHCETRIKYRAFDPLRPKHQRQLPGLTIQAPKHSTFHEGYGNYPHSACGTPADGRLLYRNRAEELGLVDDQTAVIYDILREKPDQMDNPNSRRCTRAFDVFETAIDPVADLNKCSFLVTQPPVARCLDSNRLPPIVVFTNCLQKLQGSDTGCGRLRRAARLCSGERGWAGPSDFDCTALFGETTELPEEA